MNLSVLGCRGSIPTGGIEYIKYGSDTSAYLVMTDSEAIFLDAGTGIVHAPDVGGRNISIILSHLHVDHLYGLSFFPYIRKANSITIYSAFPVEQLKNAFGRFFSPPLWPCGLEDLGAKIYYKCLDEETTIGDVKIQYMWSLHPGDSAVIKVRHGCQSIVYATDFEHSEDKTKELIAFSKNADLIMYDGQYSLFEYDRCKGYGHSTVEKGVEIFKASEAKKILFIHHDPNHDDEFLDGVCNQIKLMGVDGLLAKQGDIIDL